MLSVGNKGGRSVIFRTLQKGADLSFIDERPGGIYIVDISAVLGAQGVYRTHLERKLKVYEHKYGLSYSFYKEWVIIGDVAFAIPKLEILR